MDSADDSVRPKIADVDRCRVNLAVLLLNPHDAIGIAWARLAEKLLPLFVAH